MTGTTEEQDHPPLPDGIDRTGSGGSNGTSFSQKKRMDLADLLRDCAALVEQNEMDQKVFQRMFRELTEYVSGHGGVKPPDSAVPKRSSNAAAAAAATAPATAATAATAEPAAAPSSQTPFDEPPPAASAEPAVQNTSSRNVAQEQSQQSYSQATPPPSARKVTTTTTKHIPPPSSNRSVHDQHHQVSKEKNIKFFDKIKHAAKEAGQEFSNIAHTGQQAFSSAAKKATSAKNAQRARDDLASEFGDDWHEERRANYQERNAERRSSTTSERHHSDTSQSGARPPNPSKPPFQRPVNPNSTLIANGWLEQQRRSKMRFVWKEVLVSLVAGRRPGEETTLWVQRETTNPVTGNMGLEALHQIPIKGMQDINYVDFSTDHRFIIQVYNLSDEFVFRTRDNGDAAKNWVSTLRLTREAVLNGVAPPKPGDLQTQRTKTHPSYSGEDEKKAESPPQQQHQHHHQHQPAPPQQQQQHPRKMAVKELRAIAHAHGVNTAGMERSQLEAAVARIQQQNEGRTTPAAGGPPPAQRAGSEDDSEREAARRRQMRKDEETAARYAAEERDRAEAERRRMAEAEEQRRRQQHAEYLRQQEILRQQQAQQQAQAAAQMRAEEERRRYQQQQQYYAQQQAQAQAQAQAAAQQQYYAQQQAAQQQYYAQQQAQQQQNFHSQQAPPPGAHPPPGGHPHAPPPHAHQGPPPGQQQQQQPHGNPNKWANIIAGEDPDKEEEGSQAAITAIKHHILIQWALQPPTMQVLRPIHGLLTTVHTVFPPTQGVPGHEYFKKWKTVSMESLSDESGQPDENKLAKAVKKLRFFLHPDKLPRDLNEEQSFVCKMLWDVTSDAWEEYEKQKEQLDWLNQPAA